MAKSSVEKLAYHRNGVAGLGFHVAIVGGMLVVRFPSESDQAAGGVLCAAFSLQKLAERDIAFASNSWRGDEFAPMIDAAIARDEAAYTVEDVEQIEVVPLRAAA